MNLLVYVRAVLWGLIGIRSRAGGHEDMAKARPLVLIVVALVTVAIFGLTLFGLGNLAVSTLR